MQQITIRSIKIEGFKSYSEPVSLLFANTGLFIVRGKNGVGKSSIFSALVWALYKINLNDTNNDKVVTLKHKRTAKFKGTRVQVLLGVGKYKYIIARHIDYKGKTYGIDGGDNLLIFRKEKADKNPFSAEDVINDVKGEEQQYLNKLLGIDHKTFLNSIVFGQGMQRLMNTANKDKRDLFERLFDVDFIDMLRQRALHRQQTVEAKLVALKADQQRYTSNHSILKEQYENHVQILNDFAVTQKAVCKQVAAEYRLNKDKYLALAEELRTMEDNSTTFDGEASITIVRQKQDTARDAHYNAKEHVDTIERAARADTRELTMVSAEITKLWQDLKEVGKNTNCPTCGAKINSMDIGAAKQRIESTIKEKVAYQHTLEQRVAMHAQNKREADANVKKTLLAYTAALDKYNECKRNYNDSMTTPTRIAEIKVELRTIKANLTKLKERHNEEKLKEPPAINIKETKRRLDEVTALLPELEKAIIVKNNQLLRLEWWRNQAFGANGLKAYIFSAMLNKLNECVQVYTQAFGYTLIFGIDLAKTSKPFYCTVTLDGHNQIDYDMLSGGQKSKIDICLAFAMQDVVESKSIFNISVFDEAFEGLDDEAQEAVDMMLRIRADQKAVYIITHSNTVDMAGATEYIVSGGNKGTSIIE